MTKSKNISSMLNAYLGNLTKNNWARFNSVQIPNDLTTSSPPWVIQEQKLLFK